MSRIIGYDYNFPIIAAPRYYKVNGWDTRLKKNSAFWYNIAMFIGILKPVIYLNEDIIYKCGDDGDRS